MVEEKDGWFVVNVRDAAWSEHPDFGKRCRFEAGTRFPHTGIGISVLEPGQPACRYHRESAQEDFLVLSGECLLLVNGEERRLKAWDFVHCPPGATHVFVGAGDGPCAILMVGARPEGHEIFYPKSELARKHRAEVREETSEPRVAYADLEPRKESKAPEWPVG